jgi:MFS family permease
MTVKQRVLQRALGGAPESGLGPLLTTLGLAVTAQYVFWAFFSIWAIERLGMAEADVGLAYLAAAAVGIPSGLVGGRISDAIGRRPVIVWAGAVQALLPLLLVFTRSAPVAIAVLCSLSMVGPVRWTAQSALLADLVPEERREAAYGTFRVVFNLGALLGPVTGAALVAVSWPALHAGAAVLWGASFLASLRLARPPARVRGTKAAEDRRVSFRTIAAVRGFGFLFGAAALAMVVYNAFELLLPVSLTQSHGYPPALWGVLFVVNPLLVTVFQLRVTRWAAAVPAGTKLAAALLLMGTSFLPLVATSAPFVLVAMLVVFVFGEMLWAPTADALAARLAPVHARGTFLGVMGIAPWLGGAVAPAVGLRIRSDVGDSALWVTVAVLGVLSALLYAAAAGRARAATELEAVPEAA